MVISVMVRCILKTNKININIEDDDDNNKYTYINIETHVFCILIYF